MILSLVPISLVVNAEETPIEGQNYEGMLTADGLELAKRVTDNKDGTYKVQLEAYATGEVVTTTTIVEKAVPADIVLVLDVSGSMRDRMTVGRYKDAKGSLDTTLGQTAGYYAFDNGDTSIKYNVDTQTWQQYIYVGLWPFGSYQWVDINDNNNRLVYVRRMDALKAAVNGFIDSIRANAVDNDVDNRIAIVKFAGTKKNEIGNDTYGPYNYNYSQIVKTLTDVKADANAAIVLKDTVNSLTASGATAADYGMEHAYTIINDIPAGRESNKVIVMFTDGEPNHHSGFDPDVADDAISASKDIKDKGASVYTIGIFSGANPNGPISPYNNTQRKMNRYMHFVSSNYPNATNLNNGGTRTPGSNFYLAADNAGALSNVFQTIAEQIDDTTVTTSVELGSETVVHDIVADNFALPEGADENSINVYTVAKEAGEGNWAEPVAFAATKTVVGKSVKVSGFNFKDNCVTEDPKPETTDDYGKKLVIEFTITPDYSKTYGGNNIETNSRNTGIYKDNQLVANFPMPHADISVRYEFATQDFAIYITQTANLKDLIINTANGPDGSLNAYVDILYTIKDSNDNVVGTYLIEAGKTFAEGTFTGANVALVEDTTYKVSCAVTPIDASVTGAPAVATAGKYDGATVKNATVYVWAPAITEEDDTVDAGTKVNLKDYVEAVWTSTSGAPTPAGVAPALTFDVAKADNAVIASFAEYEMLEDTDFFVINVKAGDVAVDSANVTFSNNGTATNKYTIKVTYYSVTFDKNTLMPVTGMPENYTNVIPGAVVAAPAAPSAEGYTFGGWYTDKDCENAYDFSTAVTANITLYAKWEKLPEIVIPDETPLGPAEPTKPAEKPAPVIKIIDTTPLDGSPRTGDENVIFAWMSVLTASGLGFVLLRKKNEDKEI